MVDDTIIYDDDWMSFESLYLGNAMHIYEDDGSFSPKKLLIVPVQTWYDRKRNQFQHCRFNDYQYSKAKTQLRSPNVISRDNTRRKNTINDSHNANIVGIRPSNPCYSLYTFVSKIDFCFSNVMLSSI